MKLLLAFLFLGLLPAAAEESKAFPPEEWRSWLHIRYPADFETDPRSLKGERKWWARFSSAERAMTIEIMSHGYCSGRLFSIEGFKSPEDYVLKKVITGSPARTSHEGFDRLIRVDADSVQVVFLKNAATWGKCYEQLRFGFPDGAYESHRTTIMKVVESARPSFGK